MYSKTRAKWAQNKLFWGWVLRCKAVVKSVVEGFETLSFINLVFWVGIRIFFCLFIKKAADFFSFVSCKISIPFITPTIIFIVVVLITNFRQIHSPTFMVWSDVLKLIILIIRDIFRIGTFILY